MPRLEIASTTLDDARNAQAGGADSIEISENLALDGLTPALDLVRRIRDAVTLDIYAIVRPHARNFIYTPAEMDTILADAQALAQIGLNGIVFGSWTPDQHLDIAAIRQVQQAANLPVTVHRALDTSQQPDAALTALRGIVPRVLTSGPAANAWEGRDDLCRWVTDFGRDFRFVAAGGLRLDHLADYAAQVQAHEYHFGSAARTNGTVDPSRVRQLRAILTPN
ncbi:MAG: hypothetical protein K8J31_16630 [Anaerolineae bacterium]|nr:hypothetical protein [Anaerolineae bacterium]